MQYVFVSYFREDAALVTEVLKVLETSGIDYFIDQEGLEQGDQWAEKVRQKINGATAFLFCMSSRYYERPDSYVHIELRLASERMLAFDRSVPWFLPLCVDRCKLPELQLGHGNLSDYHAIQADGALWDIAQQCARRIGQILNDPAVTQGTIHLHSLSSLINPPAIIYGADPLAELQTLRHHTFRYDLPPVEALHSLRSKVLMHDGKWMGMSEYWSIYESFLRRVRKAKCDSLNHMEVKSDSMIRFRVPAGPGAFLVAELQAFEQHSTHGASLGFQYFLHGSDQVKFTIPAGETRAFLVRKTPRSGFLWRNRPTQADLYLTEMPPVMT